MKFRYTARIHRVATIGLLSMAGLLFAVAPAHALAKKHHRAKPGHSSVKRVKLSPGAEKKVCVDSYNGANEHMKAGQLIEAKELLGKCARAVCGPFLFKDCTTLYTRLDADIPSVVPVVADASTQPASEGKVEVKMDGQTLTSNVDGNAILVNPGEHEFSFSTENGVFATEKVSVVQGQRNRTITASLEPPVAKATAAPSRRSVVDKPREAWPMYALGGAGVLSLGTAALLTTWGRKDNSDLMQSCGTHCSPASVHHIRMLYLGADVLLGVGVVALASATWLYVTSHPTKEKASRGMALKVFDVKPTSSGAVATLGGAF